MPLRQSTLHFGPRPVLERKTPSTDAAAAPTPPTDDGDDDTIVVDTTHSPQLVSLPTPSESATDVSSESSRTSAVKNPPRSRAKRVATAAKDAGKGAQRGAPSPAEGGEKQRNMSGETLVPAVNISQTSLLNHSIAALDMAWHMGAVGHHPQPEDDDQGPDHTDDDGSTIHVAVEEIAQQDAAAVEARKEARRAKRAQREKQWERRRNAAAQNATRKSSRASLLLTKASEVVSAVTWSVLGKRAREVPDPARTIHDETEPASKKARPSTLGGDESLAAATRAMRSRAAKDKKWLLSGLYAGQTRALNPTGPDVTTKRLSKSAPTLDEPAQQPPTENTLLPLPMFAGARLLESGRDFKLPFDVFSPLPAGQPKPDEWKKVNKNVFVGDAAAEWRPSKFLEHSTCMCKPATGCDADCMNRYMYYECDERNCNLAPGACGNRAFEGLRQRVKKGGKYNVGVEVVRTTDRGYGVRANRTFEPNQIIVEYTGEIITQEECEGRMRREYKNNECYYLMAFDQNMIIDATRGSIARFVNHSCDPNCRMEKWTVGGKPRMALFAGDAGIMTGEELTYDYNFDPYSQKNVQACRCGSENCRGVLGPRPKELPKEREGKLAGAKRKLAEVLEESTNLLNVKKRKTADEHGRKALPKGWAYVEAAPSVDQGTKGKDSGPGKAQSPQWKRMWSQKTAPPRHRPKAGNRPSVGRPVSRGRHTALLEDLAAAVQERGARPRTEQNAVASLKAKAETIKRRVSRSLRGRR